MQICITHSRACVPREHGIDCFRKLCAARFVDAETVTPTELSEAPGYLERRQSVDRGGPGAGPAGISTSAIRRQAHAQQRNHCLCHGAQTRQGGRFDPAEKNGIARIRYL